MKKEASGRALSKQTPGTRRGTRRDGVVVVRRLFLVEGPHARFFCRSGCAWLPFFLFLLTESSAGAEGDRSLPEADTCASELRIPAYSSATVLEAQLLKALERFKTNEELVGSPQSPART